jgi:leader peptidase (prepilin peptidase) / N-methyltransferase
VVLERQSREALVEIRRHVRQPTETALNYRYVPMPTLARRRLRPHVTTLQASASSKLRSPVVIAGTVLVAGAAAVAQGSLASSVLRGVLVLVLVPCALIDIDRRIIPNRITGPAALLALVLGLVLDSGGEPKRLLWAAIAGGFLLLAALVNPAGMGMGDVKLLAVMGLFLGRPVIVALLLALLGSVIAGVLIARRSGIQAARKTGLPFGPYLAIGGILAAFVGDPLFHAYLSLHS